MLRLAIHSLVVGFLLSASAYGESAPWQVPEGVPPIPSAPMLQGNAGEDACRFGALQSPLSLHETVNRALCNNPQTRQSWASILAQASHVGTVRAAYFPALNANAALNHSRENVDVRDKPFFDSHSRFRDQTTSLNLSWVLIDFGLRSANLENAKELLRAANASHAVTLQTVFINTAQAYYDVWSAQTSLVAAQEAERSAQKSFHASQRKHDVGVGTLNDQLQAEIAYAQAVLNRVKAEGALSSAQGTLAISMGLSSNTAVTIDFEAGAQPNVEFNRSIEELLDIAKRNHPTLLVAQSQLGATRAKLDATIAEGMPTVAFVGSESNDSRTFQTSANTITRDKNIGVQVSFPLFEGMGRVYKTREARAQIEVSQAALENADLQVALDVWKNYQDVRTQTESVKAAGTLQKSANQAYRVSQARYESGVGNVLDLLTAQTALANAAQQLIQAQASWRVARLRLAASVGQLGMWEAK
jgi:outer membrane protein